MNLEDQVCSLELSRKLCELGVFSCASFYSWIFNPTLKIKPNEPYIERTPEYPMINAGGYIIAAFTASELMEMLPVTVDYDEEDYYLFVEKLPHNEFGDYEYEIKYIRYTTSYEENDKNLCNALAKMLINLVENKLMEIKQ